jgi:hypothetical protein
MTKPFCIFLVFGPVWLLSSQSVVSATSRPTVIPRGGTFFSVSGSGLKNTRPFSAPGIWQFHWSHTGESGSSCNFIVDLYQGNNDLDNLVNDLSVSKSITSWEYHGGKKLHLDVNSGCDHWHIWLTTAGHYATSFPNIYGSGIENTRPFTAPGQWQFHWTHTGDSGSSCNFIVDVYHGQSDLDNLVNDLSKHKSGSTWEYQGGKQLHLSIESGCDHWHVWESK